MRVRNSYRKDRYATEIDEENGSVGVSVFYDDVGAVDRFFHYKAGYDYRGRTG